MAGHTAPLPAVKDESSPGKVAQTIQPRRLGIFGGIGVVVFVLGTAFQAGLIALGDGRTASYLWQAVFSIELSFGLNRWVTWRDRHVHLGGSLLKWNLQKLALTVPNVVAYAFLVRQGMNWLVANLLLTAVFTLTNYIGANIWSFRAMHLARHRAGANQRVGGRVPAADIEVAPLAHEQAPEVSIVIPVKNSQLTIRRTIEALLAQDYPALAEVIVVGDVGDRTWQALEDIGDPRLLILEHEEVPGKREPAIKRDVGLRKARGEVLALADSDIVMDRDWLSRAVSLLLAQRGGAVCGGMRTADDTFWGRFVDRNSIAAKTPRVPRSYVVTPRNFGKHGRKPPITANVVMTRDLYDDCPMDVTWAFGYEDYEWFWRVASRGHQVLFAAGQTGAHHHRSSFRALAREYKISASGAAEFIRAYPECPLSRKRSRQAVVLPLAALAALAGAAAAAVVGFGTMVLAAVTAVALGMSAREAVRARRLEAVVYPVAGVMLGLLFTIGLAGRLATTVQASPDREDSDDPLFIPASFDYACVPDDGRFDDGTGLGFVGLGVDNGHLVLTDDRLELAPRLPGRDIPPASVRETLGTRLALGLAFLSVLAAGAAVRFWQLPTKPDIQSDESVYADIARNLLIHGTLNEHLPLGEHWTPFLYQPPLYMLALARWFAEIGPSIYHARILGVLCSLGSLALLWRLVWRQLGPQAALYASLPVIFDGWLLFVQRVSYIENVTLLLMVAGLVLYQRALDSSSWHRFVVAGVVIGLAVSVKYTGIYAIPTVVLSWLIVRREHKGHLIMLSTALAILVADQVALVRLFDVPGHQWYIDQTLIQLGRVSGISQSGGTLSSPAELLHLLFAQYKLFIPSLLIAVAALVIVIRRLLYCYRRRSVASLRPQAVLFAWTVAGVVIFGVSSLRYPQYFALVLVPMYCLWWTEVWNWNRGMAVKAALAAVAVVAGLGSFWLRVGAQSEDVFAETQQYAATHIPKNAVVLADETIGDLISQPYCQEQAAKPCLWRATYAITWSTYLQSSFKLGDSAFALMMQGATKQWSRTGFNGTITVWRLH